MAQMVQKWPKHLEFFLLVNHLNLLSEVSRSKNLVKQGKFDFLNRMDPFVYVQSCNVSLILDWKKIFIGVRTNNLLYCLKINTF